MGEAVRTTLITVIFVMFMSSTKFESETQQSIRIPNHWIVIRNKKKLMNFIRFSVRI